MRVPRLYVADDLATGTTVTLEGQPAHYLSKVLRFTPGAEVALFNGHGGVYHGRLTEVTKRRARVRLEQFFDQETESPLPVVLAQGVCRGERMDYAVQKAVELGVNQIVPLLTSRCGVRLDAERASKRRRHWQAVAAAACEQCGRNHVPMISAAVNLTQWLAAPPTGQGLVLAPEHGQRLGALPHPTGVTLVVGPEGGLTPDEVQQSQQAGYRAACLGPRVLRTETAAAAALAAIQTLWGDLS